MKLLTIVVALVLTGCAGTGPGKYTHVPRTEKCKPTSEKKIAALFDRWNDSLLSGDPHKVVANSRKIRYCCPPSPTSRA